MDEHFRHAEAAGDGPRERGSPARWSAFREGLLRDGVQARLLPYYEGRVRQWLDLDLEVLPGQRPERVFSRWLEMQRVPEWQCRQGFQAVRRWLAQEGEGEPDPEPASEEPVEVPVRSTSWREVAFEMEQRLRAQQYSGRTVDSYMDWVRRLAQRSSEVPATAEEASELVQGFLRELVIGRNLSPNSVAQARNALAWLVRRQLGLELTLEDRGDSHHGKRLPKVIAPEQVRALLGACRPPWDVFFGLQYGCGLRLMEVLDLRVQDVDLVRGSMLVRHGKGDKDRMLPLPLSLRTMLEGHLEARREQWAKDLEAGWANVDLPHALGRKFGQGVSRWEWQHVFGSARPLRHPETGEMRRWRPMENLVRDALRRAAEAAGLDGRVHPHLLRHCYATHLLESGMPIRQIQELMGHARLETTMVYMHVRSQGCAVRSPLDMLAG